MKYIKRYDTKSCAIDDKEVVSPIVGHCNENNQSIIGVYGLADDTALLIKLESEDPLAKDLYLEEKGAVNPKDVDGYYLVDLSGILSGDYLYSTPDGKLTLESEGNTAIAKFAFKNIYDTGGDKNCYIFYSICDPIYIGTNDIKLYAALPNENYVYEDNGYGYKYTNYIYSTENFKNGLYPLFELTYNYSTLGTQKGDWILPKSYYFHDKNLYYVNTEIMHHLLDDTYDVNGTYILKSNVNDIGIFNILDGTYIYDPDYGAIDYKNKPLYLQPALIIKNLQK